MSGPIIRNGANYPINYQIGTTPDVSGALLDTLQRLTFVQVVKSVVGFEVLETPVTTSFWGVIMPLSPRELKILDIGERPWSLYRVYAQTQLILQVDDVITIPWINNKQTRVMSLDPFGINGYYSYSMVQDWTGSGV